MTLLTQTLVYLAAGVIAAPLAKRLKLGSVLGYLIAGLIMGRSPCRWSANRPT